MAYAKYGVVTRIDLLKNKKEGIKYIKDNFDLNFFVRNKNSYLLNNAFINDNLKDLREEFLTFSNFFGDSFDSCEAYCIETDIDELMNHNIILVDNCEKFYFEGYNDFVFDTDCVLYFTNKFSFKLFLIPIFWDINRIESESFNTISLVVNNLTRKCMKNKLKDVSFFTII